MKSRWRIKFSQLGKYFFLPCTATFRYILLPLPNLLLCYVVICTSKVSKVGNIVHKWCNWFCWINMKNMKKITWRSTVIKNFFDFLDQLLSGVSMFFEARVPSELFLRYTKVLKYIYLVVRRLAKSSIILLSHITLFPRALSLIWVRILIFTRNFWKNLFIFHDKMKMKNFAFSDGVVSLRKKAYEENPQPLLNSNMYLVFTSDKDYGLFRPENRAGWRNLKVTKIARTGGIDILSTFYKQ